MNVYLRSLLAVLADGLFLAVVGLESAALIAEEGGMAIAKAAGIEWAGGLR